MESRNPPEFYEDLEKFLHTTFALLEGAKGLDSARLALSEYLEWHRKKGLPEESEDFLINLFFDKCRKKFLPGTIDQVTEWRKG